MAMAALIGLTATAGAQTVAYTANVNTSYGGASTGNGYSSTLNMGQIFSVKGAGIEVFQLGFFDYQNHPLAGPHTVTLFTNQTAIASVTIPAGSAALLLDSYAFEPLSTPIYLPAGSYTVLAYGVDAADPYGEGSQGNVGFNGSANLSAVNTCFDFTAQGSPDYPGGPGDTGNPWSITWGDPSADASFTYTNAAWPVSTWTGAVDTNWSTDGNWNTAPVFPAALTFAGSTRLTNNNNNTGITVEGITFDAAAGAFVLGGNGIVLGGNIGFTGNPASPITQTIDLPLAPSVGITIDTPTNAMLVVGGGATSGNGLTKVDGGTLILAGTNTFAGFSGSGGTNEITGNTTFNGTGSTTFYLADGDTYNSVKDTLIIQPGANLSVTGNLGDAGVLGRDTGSGYVIQNGGTFTFAPANQAYLFVGATSYAGTRSEYDMNGGLLNLSGLTLGLALSDRGVLSTSVVYQAGGVITNVASLWLGAVFTSGEGIYTLAGGSLYLGAGGATNTGSYLLNLGGGTLGAEASWSSSLNINLTNLNGSVTFRPAGNTITLSGVLSGNGGLAVAGGGTLELSGANTYTGDTAVGAGSTLQLDSTGSGPGALRLANGSTLNLNFSGIYAVGGCYTNGVALAIGSYNAANLPGFIIGSGTLEVVHGVSTGFWTGSGADNNWSTANNWDNDAVPIFPHAVSFTNSTRLVNNNDLSGITVSSLMFGPNAGAFVLGGNGITLSGSIGFSANPPAPITETVNLDMAFTGSQAISLPANGNLDLGGSLTSGSGLVSSGAGTLTLGGANDSFTALSVDGGTNVITGDVTIAGTGSSLFYIGDSGAVGTLVIQPGAALNVTGSFGDAGVIGRNSGSGTIIQNGGTFSFNPGNIANLFIGASSSAATRAVYDMNGGTLDMNSYNLDVALSANAGTLITGVVNQVGGTINNVGEFDLGAYTFGPGHGIYNLTGGSIYINAGGIQSDSGSYEIYLGGGTVGADGNWSSPLNMMLTGTNGPVTFDTGGSTIQLTGVLTGAGGFNVIGGGTLELGGANTYTGDAVVTAGTLQLDVTGSSAGALRMVNGTSLYLNFSGSYVVSHFYTNGVALPSGTYNSSNLSGFIIGSGNLLVQGVSTGLWTGLGANNNWSTAGNWNNAAEPIFPIGLTFAGSTRLNNNNDLTGVTADSITFDSAAGAFTVNGNSLGLNGGIGFNGVPTAPVTQTIDLPLVPAVDVNITAPANGNLAISGNITAPNNTVYKLGNGTLTMAGDNTFAGFDVDGGTNIIAGSTTVAGTGNTRTYVANADYVGGAVGTLVIPAGATFAINGTFADAYVIGRDGGQGTLVQNGGTFSFNPGNQSYLFVAAGDSSTTRGEYDMNGGLLDMNGKTLGVALGVNILVTGVVNQVSGVITNVDQIFLDSFFSTGHSIYNLTGGSLYIEAGGITVQAGGTYEIYFGGGTVAAEASWSSALSITLTGSNGPVTFDPAGNTITLSGALSGPGGLTVTGGGLLELSGTNTYAGTTTVNTGSTLQLDVPGSTIGSLRVASGAVVDLNYIGTCVVGSLYTNGVAVLGGTYNADNLPGYLTGTGMVQVGVNTPKISFSTSSGHISITWPAGYEGWVLQVQTNSLAVGLSTNWVDVTGTGGVTSTNIPVNTTTPTTFYRLRQPKS
jgi:autotransporter-associated beta strand protein